MRYIKLYFAIKYLRSIDEYDHKRRDVVKQHIDKLLLK